MNTAVSSGFIAVASTSILINTTCLYLVLTDRQLKLKLMNVFLIGLFLSYDLLSAVDICRSVFAFLGYSLRPGYNPLIGGFVRFVFLRISICFLVLLSIDRYLAVKHPFFYKTLTWKHGTVAAIVNAVLSFVCFVNDILMEKSYYSVYIYVYNALVAIVAIIITALTWSVYKVAKQQQLQISKVTIKDYNKDLETRTAEHRHTKMRVKSMVISLGIVLTFTMFWMPLWVYSFVSPRTGNDNMAAKLLLFSTLDTIVNPVLYIGLNREVRRSFTKRLLNNRVQYKSS